MGCCHLFDPRCHWLETLGDSWWWYLASLAVGNEQKFQKVCQMSSIPYSRNFLDLVLSCLSTPVLHYPPVIHYSPAIMILEQATAGFCLRTFGLTIQDAPLSCVWPLFILQLPSSISPPKIIISQSFYLNSTYYYFSHIDYLEFSHEFVYF